MSDDRVTNDAFALGATVEILDEDLRCRYGHFGVIARYYLADCGPMVCVEMQGSAWLWMPQTDVRLVHH